ncbi:MAG TPA: hypothetical protein VNA29_09525 [Sphingomicrobium sp.]|nr:hypothetical protein [Sphingomicrobium sp.]
MRIWSIDPRGRLTLVHDNRGSHSHAIAIDASGQLVWEESRYDPATGRYTEFVWQRANGRTTRRFGPLRNPTPGLGITRDSVGCTWRYDRVGQGGPALVHRLCPGRRPVRLYGSAADEARFRPELVNDSGGVALASDGSFLFRHGGTVRAITRDGRIRMVAAGLSAHGSGIALDDAGGLLVADNGNRRVIRIAGPKRQLVATSPPGWAPTGVAVRARVVYVLEASDYRRGQPIRMRVRRVDGQRIRLLAQVTLPDV